MKIYFIKGDKMMDKSWKVFRSESGICSLENRSLEERSFYRMRVFLRNLFRDQYIEENTKQEHNSFLYSLVIKLRNRGGLKVYEDRPEARYSLEFYLARQKFILTWDSVLGLVLSAADTSGNEVIDKLNEVLMQEGEWL